MQPDRNLSLGIRPSRYRMNLIKLQHGPVWYELVDGIERRIDRTVACRLHCLFNTIKIKRKCRRLWAHGAGNDDQGNHLRTIGRRRNALIYQGFDVLIVDVLLAICERLEPREGIFQLIFAQFIPEFLQLVAERVSA